MKKKVNIRPKEKPPTKEEYYIKKAQIKPQSSSQKHLFNHSSILSSNQSNTNASIISSNPNKIIKQNKSYPLSIINQIENLTSIYNALLYIKNNLENTFQSQRFCAEISLNEKTISNLKLREENFKAISKLNSMNDITNIDEYFLNIYDKIMSNAPKVNNIIENINDFTSNIKYGLDRLYLNGNIACDENLLRMTITTTINDIDSMSSLLQQKSKEIKSMKDNYGNLLKMISNHKVHYDNIQRIISNFKANFLCNNINKITCSLQEENKNLLNNIIQ